MRAGAGSWLGLPTALTLCRLPLAVAFPFVRDRPVAAIAVLAAAGLTDVLDGALARRLHQETRAGALIDGIVDKIFVLVVAATLLHDHKLALWEMLALGARDAGEAILLGVYWLRVRHAPAEEQRANALGKATTLVQFATVVAAILGRGPVAMGAGAAAVLGLATVVSYARRVRFAAEQRARAS